MDAVPDSLLEQLKTVTLCAPLLQRALQHLAAVVKPIDYDDGQIIMLEGDVGAPVFFIIEGTVRAFRTNLDGREQNLIHLSAGEAFNMPAAFAPDQTAPVSAAAVGAVRLLCITPADFSRIVSQTPEIALAVLRDFSAKLVHLTNLTHDLSLRSVRGRLARFLITQARSDTPPHWTHEAIAAQIGTVREVVSRTMRAFVREGLIEMNRQQVVLLDPQALERET
ncbi:MAG: Crp/Fnr family transcriptional regulator [Anaerolineae bacterium]|nr:Crp/Fnr family transcriptional regulator [Anaerolineae bacterium]